MNNEKNQGAEASGKAGHVPAVYFVDSDDRVIDIVATGDLALSSGRTKEQLEAEHGSLRIMDAQAAIAAAEARHIQDVPHEITRAVFLDMLDIMPPLKWTGGGPGGESFRIMEPYTYSVHEAFVRYGERYFKFMRPLSDPHHKLIELVKTFVDAKPVETIT